MNSQVSIPKERLAAFCRAHGVKRFAVFGSALREDFGPESDVDVLVEFEPGRAPGLLGVAGMERELSDLFGGRKVDLIERSAVEASRNYIRRESILHSAETIYAA
ncbi:MAG: nucleotidyltransferase family protein [Nitrospinae bacterium]|nr:nucleotidyltransferase family protein [Nitrospinota bacterium]